MQPQQRNKGIVARCEVAYGQADREQDHHRAYGGQRPDEAAVTAERSA